MKLDVEVTPSYAVIIFTSRLVSLRLEQGSFIIGFSSVFCVYSVELNPRIKHHHGLMADSIKLLH